MNVTTARHIIAGPPAAKPETTVTGAFFASAASAPDAPALWVDGTLYSYSELAGVARHVAAAIRASDHSDAGCAILAYRSLPTYAGILGTLAAGRAYTPLSPRIPVDRNRRILAALAPRTLLVDAPLARLAREILAGYDTPLNVIMMAGNGAPHTDSIAAPHVLSTVRMDDSPPGDTAVADPAMDAAAYVLFTSGSTGLPKGVVIEHGCVARYVDTICRAYAPEPDARMTQLFDPTFDLSVHDMFVTWAAGACLYCVPEKLLFTPIGFANEHALTHWFSTPTTASMLMRYRQLKPDALPGLQVSLFCGEALARQTAEAWRAAAPNSVIDNLYGPTEATIAITAHRVAAAGPAAPADTVAIGQPFNGQSAALLAEDGSFAAPGEIGELIVSGDQLARGYLNAPDQTAAAFIELGTPPVRWYRTGDLARYDDDDGFVYLGRLDNQIKLRGHRIELGEIEAVLRDASGSALVAAIAWPVEGQEVGGITAFVAGTSATAEDLRTACEERLLAAAVPSTIHIRDTLPVNASGKTDRIALRDWCRDNATTG